MVIDLDFGLWRILANFASISMAQLSDSLRGLKDAFSGHIEFDW